MTSAASMRYIISNFSRVDPNNHVGDITNPELPHFKTRALNIVDTILEGLSATNITTVTPCIAATALAWGTAKFAYGCFRYVMRPSDITSDVSDTWLRYALSGAKSMVVGAIALTQPGSEAVLPFVSYSFLHTMNTLVGPLLSIPKQDQHGHA